MDLKLADEMLMTGQNQSSKNEWIRAIMENKITKKIIILVALSLLRCRKIQISIYPKKILKSLRKSQKLSHFPLQMNSEYIMIKKMKQMSQNSINLSGRSSNILAQNSLKYIAKHYDLVTMTFKIKARQKHHQARSSQRYARKNLGQISGY